MSAVLVYCKWTLNQDDDDDDDELGSDCDNDNETMRFISHLRPATVE